MEELQRALADPAIREEAIGVLRGLIERVVIRPAEDGLEIEVVGEIARMVALGVDGSTNKKAALDERTACSLKVVAGACNHRQFAIPI